MSPRFDADFVRDLREAQLGQLRREGYAVDDLEQKDETWVGLAWATAILQRIPRRRRAALWSRELAGRAELRDTLRAVVRAIRGGRNLNPFLSGRHRRLGVRKESVPGKTIERPSGIDLAFASWGIHHLHLGPPSAKRVARTDLLLFALFRDDAAYLVNCYGHTGSEGASPFAKRELLEIVHRNWPALLGQPIGDASGSDPTDAELDAALRAGLTVPINLGGKAYLIGKGIMSSTHSAAALDLTDDALNRAVACQRECERRVEEIAEAMRAETGSSPTEIALRFVLNGRVGHVVEKRTGKRLAVEDGKLVLR